MAKSEKTWYVAQCDYAGLRANIFSDKEEYYPENSWLAEAFSVPNSDNLLRHIEMFAGIKTVNAFRTKKEAEETAAYWNECFKRNGTYFDRRQCKGGEPA